jgi:transposase
MRHPQQVRTENDPVEGSPATETDRHPPSEAAQTGESSEASSEEEPNFERSEALLYLYRFAPYSRRSDIGEQRAACQELYYLTKCTPLQLRDHLKTDLKSLRFNEKDRLGVLQSIGAVPDEEVFWLTLQEVWTDYQDASKLQIIFSSPPQNNTHHRKSHGLGKFERHYSRVDQVQTVTGDNVEIAFVDQAYTEEQAAQAAEQYGIKLEVGKLPEAKRGFVLLPRRWVVERSFAWAARFRRLVPRAGITWRVLSQGFFCIGDP